MIRINLLPRDARSSARSKPRSARFFKVISLLTLGLVASCKVPEHRGEQESYIENGQVWAYGSVQLTHLEAPGVVVIERVAGVQTIDSGGAPAQGVASGSGYILMGAVQATPGEGDNGRRDLAYVDFHPSNDRLLAYAWSIEARPRAGRTDIVDVNALLRKAGRTFSGYRRVRIGEAVFTAGTSRAQMTLGAGVKMSLIADGVFQGQWALHYPDARMVEAPNFAGFCRGSVTQLPGQLPQQNPGQRVACRPLPAQVDLCNGSPLGESCRPTPPAQSAAQSASRTTQVEGFEVVGDPARNVFATREAAPANPQSGETVNRSEEGKIVFVSEQISATSESNAELCAEKFYAVARTEGDQVNAACRLRLAPSESVGGKLSCAVTVVFENAQTYLEKICNVSGMFVGSGETPRTVQVLKQ